MYVLSLYVASRGPHGGEQSGSTSCVGRSLASCGLSLQLSVLYTWKINHSSLIQSHMRSMMRSWTLRYGLPMLTQVDK